MSLTSNSIISYSNSESHIDLSSKQTGASLNLYKLQGLLKGFQKKKRLTIEKKPSLFRVMKTQTYSNMLQIPSIALSICRSTDIKGTCLSGGIEVVWTAENTVTLLAEQPTPNTKAIDLAHGNTIYSSCLQGKCLKKQWRQQSDTANRKAFC